jgi:hypothetical protein
LIPEKLDMTDTTSQAMPEPYEPQKGDFVSAAPLEGKYLDPDRRIRGIVTSARLQSAYNYFIQEGENAGTIISSGSWVHVATIGHERIYPCAIQEMNYIPPSELQGKELEFFLQEQAMIYQRNKQPAVRIMPSIPTP